MLTMQLVFEITAFEIRTDLPVKDSLFDTTRMFDNIPFASLQLLALMSHFILTTGLVWTRYDCLQVTLKASANRSDYDTINRSYTGLISVGIIALLFEMVMTTASTKRVSLFGAIKLFMDLVACFFISWIILDGLDWRTYIYIFVFCVLIPTIGDVITFFVFLNKNVWVDWRQTRTIYQSMAECWAYVGTLFVCFSADMCAPAEIQPEPWASWGIVDGCTSCFTWIQTKGISGMCTWCWSCTAATVSSPSTLFTGCWAWVSGACSSTAEFCSSCSGALMQGPTGVAEFCSSSISACSADDSLFYRCLGGFSYVGSGIWSGMAYIGTSCSSCASTYGPVLYDMMISVRDFLYSCLMWLWRQVRMFFT